MNTATSAINTILQRYYPPSAKGSLHKAASRSAVEVAAYLRKHGLNEINKVEEDNPHQLTPLHVAVLTGDRQVVTLLVKKGASLTVQDVTGNTPAHLAAMRGDQEMVKTLRELATKTHQQFEEIQNNYFATVATLEKITKNPVEDPRKQVCLWKNAKGEIVPLTAQEYLFKTKTQYIEYVVTSPQLLCYHWATKKPVKDHFTEGVWKKYSSKKTKLILEEQRAPKTKRSIGLGVRTGEPLAGYAFLGPWGGELLPENTQEQASDLKMDNLECLRFSSLDSRFNDGFPMATTSTFNVEGCPDGIGVFLRKEGLAEGKIVTIHYGPHPCKFGYYELLHRKKLEAFCKRSNFEESQRQIKKLHVEALTIFDGKLVLQLESEVAPCAYILETPKAMVHLITKNLLKGDDLKFLESVVPKDNLHVLTGMQGIINNFRKKLISILKGVESLPAFKADFFVIVDRLFQKHRVVTAMMTVHYLVDYRALAESYLRGPKEFDYQIRTILETAQLIEQFIDTAPDLIAPAKSKEALCKLRTLRERILRLNEKSLHPSMLPTWVRLIHNAEICDAVFKTFPPESYPKTVKAESS